VAQKATRRIRYVLPEGMKKFEIFRTGLLHSSKPATATSAWIISPNPATNRHLARKAHAPSQFSGYTTKSGADFRHGRHGHQRLSQRLRAKSARPRKLAIGNSRRGLATMRGYHLSATITFAARSSAACSATPSSQKAINAEFGIDFDSYFAAELQRFEIPREDGLLLLSTTKSARPARPHLHPQSRHDFRSLLEKQHLDAKPLFSKRSDRGHNSLSHRHRRGISVSFALMPSKNPAQMFFSSNPFLRPVE